VKQQKPMKHYNALFDIFLFEGIFLFFFSTFLTLLNDPVSDFLYPVAAGLFFAGILLGVIGKLFHLFRKEPQYEEH
jgi:hypothetical protein